MVRVKLVELSQCSPAYDSVWDQREKRFDGWGTGCEWSRPELSKHAAANWTPPHGRKRQGQPCTDSDCMAANGKARHQTRIKRLQEVQLGARF